MSWLQLRLCGEKADAAQLESALLNSGALSVTLQDAGDDPVLEPGVGETPLWQVVHVTGLFRADTDMKPILHDLRALPGGESARVDILEDQDWEREWMQHYQPMQFGKRLWICPSWQDPPDPQGINLLLDPGLAFGTGTHPTTAMCLEALDSLYLAGRLKDATVVDFGCGSGILAIAAAKLGAQKVLAIDNDPQALHATRDNAEHNAIASTALSIHLPENYPKHAWRSAANVVVANILAGPLAALADELCDLLSPGGTLLLAGLLDTQMMALIECYRPRLALRERARRDEWVCLEGRLGPE